MSFRPSPHFRLDQPTALLYDVWFRLRFTNLSTIASTSPDLQLVSINSLTFNQKLSPWTTNIICPLTLARSFVIFITSADPTQVSTHQPHLPFPHKDTVLFYPDRRHRLSRRRHYD